MVYRTMWSDIRDEEVKSIEKWGFGEVTIGFSGIITGTCRAVVVLAQSLL